MRWARYGQRIRQPITPKPGELGNYCLACPQVGFNVAENWKADLNQWVYRRRVVTVDGNFMANHVRQPLAADDVWLSDRLGMTTRNSEYKAFLQSTQECKTVSVNNLGSFGIGSLQKAPCANNFRAIEQAMRFSKACDITGIVSIACAWHGCFAPNSIVNLFCGEQQKNVDWSFLECIRTTNVDLEQGVMLIYDIICQYFIYLDTSCRMDWKSIGRSDSSMFTAVLYCASPDLSRSAQNLF